VSANFSVYGIADQAVWRDATGAPTVAVFLRAMGAPDDRNLVDWCLDAGLKRRRDIRGRDNDTFGVGYGLAHVSDRAAALDRDRTSISGAAFAPRSAEHIIEATYEAQLAPWWQLQPDFQYVINPRRRCRKPASPDAASRRRSDLRPPNDNHVLSVSSFGRSFRTIRHSAGEPHQFLNSGLTPRVPGRG